MSRRTDLRRMEREAERAQCQSQDGDAHPGEDLVLLEERLELQVQVMSAVRALQPPLRTVILLRYFEQQPLAAIAERTGTPVRTVEAQLRRGRELLRERLDGHFGDRSSWATLALPLALPPGLSHVPASPDSIGSPNAEAQGPRRAAESLNLKPPVSFISTAIAAMGAKTLLAVAVAALVLLIGSSLTPDSDPAGETAALEPATHAKLGVERRAEPEVAPVESSTAQRLEPGEANAPAATLAEGSAPMRRIIRGVAFHGDGAPYPELELRLTPPLASVDSVRTSASGAFEFEAELSDDWHSQITPKSSDLVVLARRALTDSHSSSQLPGSSQSAPA